MVVLREGERVMDEKRDAPDSIIERFQQMTDEELAEDHRRWRATRDTATAWSELDEFLAEYFRQRKDVSR